MSQSTGHPLQQEFYFGLAHQPSTQKATPYRLPVTIKEVIAQLSNPKEYPLVFSTISFYKRQGVNSLTSDGHDVTDLVREGGFLDRAQRDEKLLSELKIRLTVKENDFEHATKEAADLKTGITVIAKLVGSHVNAGGIVNFLDRSQEQQRELDRLDNHAKIFNRISASTDCMCRGVEKLASSVAAQSSSTLNSKGEEVKIENHDDSSGGHNAYGHRLFGHDSLAPVDQAIPRNLQQLANTKPSSSFGSNSTTVPNSLTLAQANTTSRGVSNLKDVGLESLEIVMGSDMSGSGPASLAAKGVDTKSTHSEYVVDFDNEFFQKEINDIINKKPVPGVLKTGGDMTGVRGAEYDFTKAGPNNRQAGRLMTAGRSFDPQSHPAAAYPIDAFNSRQQFEASVSTHQYTHGRTSVAEPKPAFYQYGIQYQPGPTDKDYLRAVIITGLPAGTSLRETLLIVRGGIVVKANLAHLPNVGVSAYVQFLYEADAAAFALYTEAFPLTFGKEGNEVPLTVKQLESPTYPFTAEQHQSVFKWGHTRVLTIPNFPDHFPIMDVEDAVISAINHAQDFLLEVFLSEEGTLNLEFSSITAANVAYGVLTSNHYYKAHFKVQYGRDFCSGDFEELALPQKPRVPMFPRDRKPQTDTLPQAQFKVSNGVGIDQQVEQLQRKRFAASSTVAAPVSSFSGTNIKGRPWADMVDSESDREKNGCHDSSSTQQATQSVVTEPVVTQPFVTQFETPHAHQSAQPVTPTPASLSNDDETEIDSEHENHDSDNGEPLTQAEVEDAFIDGPLQPECRGRQMLTYSAPNAQPGAWNRHASPSPVRRYPRHAAASANTPPDSISGLNIQPLPPYNGQALLSCGLRTGVYAVYDPVRFPDVGPVPDTPFEYVHPPAINPDAIGVSSSASVEELEV